MPISLQSLETLEFPKIREQLARHVAFSASRDLALLLLPSTDPYDVRRNQHLTSEARRILDDHPEMTIGGARDVRGAVGLARRGGTLEGSALLEIAGTLAGGRRLRAQILKLDTTTYAQLHELAIGLPNLPAIEDQITRAIGDDGGVLDSASPALGRLRAEVRIAYGRLQDRLQSMISSSQAESLQEPIITIRNGRYVVPVKASHRRNIRGLVHDQSASGATLYIEPLVIVELNNKWRELQFAEEQEVQRILAELSDIVGAEAAAIVAGVEALALIDLAFAKAKYSLSLRCVEPEIVDVPTNDTHPLFLSQARHPLLDQSKVVPIDLRLGGEFRMLLITGPNTGGKTVALKTAGLLALMAQAGLHIPAREPSRLPVFGKIFADIGDEQSIEQSLSTFSSHMTNIIRILRAIDGSTDDRRPTVGQVVQEQPKPATVEQPTLSQEELERLSNWRKVDPSEWAPLDAVFEEPQPALVLLDELGAGTDPVEGAALARAIIERLLDRGILGIATTHYAELKAFAYATPGVMNSSVEFNVETLAPTYRLTIGLPGRSNALAIATRLGLDPTLVDRARTTMAHEDSHVEDLLAGIHHEREAAAVELRRSEELRADAEKYRDRLAEEMRLFEERREAEWQAARDELDAEMREASSQIRRLRDEFRTVTLSRQWLEEAEKRLQSAKELAPTEMPGKPKVIAPPKPAEPTGPRPLQIGDTVLVRSVGLMGEILSIDEDERAADVQVGGFRMRAELAELQRQKGMPGGKAANDRRNDTRSSLPPTPDVSIDLDMRGWRAADVADRVERYLSDAYLAGLPLVRLIHGKGTGALRQVVRDMLKNNKLVASFNDASPADGGAGATVVRLIQQ